jgi:hypothetical protein
MPVSSAEAPRPLQYGINGDTPGKRRDPCRQNVILGILSTVPGARPQDMGICLCKAKGSPVSPVGKASAISRIEHRFVHEH